MAFTAVGTELGFQDLDAELEQTDLDVDGGLPAWLGGSLLRTGPARWDLKDGSVLPCSRRYRQALRERFDAQG